MKVGKNPGKTKTLQQFVSVGKAAQEAINKTTEITKDPEAGEKGIKPENLPAMLIDDLRKRKMQIDEEREYFIERGINPYLEAFEILLSFFNKFDTVAGMKAKT